MGNCINRPIMEGVVFNSLSLEDSLSLELPFSKEEIREAVWNCEGLKILGPDGFSLIFVKKCWFFLKEDFVSCFKDFHSGAMLSKVITSSFITLIPKFSNPLGLDDYRSIFLLGCIHKIISKLLDGKVKKVLATIISQSQSAFVSGRQMLDGVLVANELVDYASRERRECLLFNVDFEKVYDKVIWNFLKFMMKRMVLEWCG